MIEREKPFWFVLETGPGPNLINIEVVEQRDHS